MATGSGEKLLTFRKELGLNQLQFWSKVGVTQSGGSRYESGRTVPKPVVLALVVAYIPSNKLSLALNKIREGSFDFGKGLTSL